MLKRNLLSAIILTAAAFGAQAADEPYKGPVPAALQAAKTAGQLEVVKTFPAISSLVGWVVKDVATGKNLVVYTTKDGEAMVAGLVVDKTGKNLTADFTEKYVPGPDYKIALDDFTKNSAYVTLGAKTAPAEITVVFDANCSFCKVMHRLIEPAVNAGELRVHYVPVAILGADSDKKGAGVLASKNPAAAVSALVNGSGGIEASADPALLAKVRENTALMKKHGFSGTPAVMYFGGKANKDTVFVANGVPNIVEMFGKLGISGQVDKLKADPSLARFLK